MKNVYALKRVLLITLFTMIGFCQSAVYAQVSLSSSGGTPAGFYTTLSDAFTAINSGTHTGTIGISIDGNIVEPFTPVALIASGQGSASYTGILIKPTVTATISGTVTSSNSVITLDGADNVTIDGSISIGGVTKDLTIINTAANTVTATAVIRLIGRTTLGLGNSNITIKNCNIIGNTPGNSGFSGSTVTSSIGIYAGATTISAAGTGNDYDNLLIENNSIRSCYNGIHVMGGTDHTMRQPYYSWKYDRVNSGDGASHVTWYYSATNCERNYRREHNNEYDR